MFVFGYIVSNSIGLLLNGNKILFIQLAYNTCSFGIGFTVLNCFLFLNFRLNKNLSQVLNFYVRRK